MNKAVLYHKANQAQRYNAQQALQEFAIIFEWRSDGRDSVLDAGCGTGDVTFDLLLPILPPNFERVVGVDISKEMIEYARETQLHPRERKNWKNSLSKVLSRLIISCRFFV